jgi:hypothetical protein
VRDNEEHPQHTDDIRAGLITAMLDDYGWAAVVDNARGFANEYTVYIGPSRKLPEDYEDIDNVAAGALIAYTGDDATRAYNSLVVCD